MKPYVIFYYLIFFNNIYIYLHIYLFIYHKERFLKTVSKNTRYTYRFYVLLYYQFIKRVNFAF